VLLVGTAAPAPVVGSDAAAFPAWVLTEGHAGMEAQALGLAEALGVASEPRRLRARLPWDWLPGRLWPLPLHGVTAEAGALRPPWPRLVVTCGNVAAPVGAALRRRGVAAVHVQHPKMDPSRFDVVVAAVHDGLTGPNVVVTRTALHRASPERLAEARATWAPRLAHLPRPLVAVLVGGPNGRFRLDVPVASSLANLLAVMARLDKAGLAVTPSRRTAPEVVAALSRQLAPLGAFVWDGTGDNPYFGLLALADAIVVTCDSVSMMSEAAATAAPILIVELPGRSRRIGAFIDMLMAERRAHHFTGRFQTWPVTPIDDTPMAAAEVRRRLGL
jgi:mitochondrial fission protein ELM1